MEIKWGAGTAINHVQFLIVKVITMNASRTAYKKYFNDLEMSGVLSISICANNLYRD